MVVSPLLSELKTVLFTLVKNVCKLYEIPLPIVFTVYLFVIPLLYFTISQRLGIRYSKRVIYTIMAKTKEYKARSTQGFKIPNV